VTKSGKSDAWNAMMPGKWPCPQAESLKEKIKDNTKTDPELQNPLPLPSTCCFIKTLAKGVSHAEFQLLGR